MDLNEFIINPITLMALVFGLVELVKKLGLSGNKLILVSMAMGIAFGVIYQLRTAIPVSAPYIDIGFFGIAVGLAASGFYNFLNARFPAKE